MNKRNKIIIKGARQNNLKNISIDLPKDKLIVFTGLSGSGKSTFAMDTIFSEGQRRYMESLNSYARQFLGQMEKPDVDSIENLNPAIAIDQKTTSKNPRSTVGTVTEIYDYLRLLYARIGHVYCPDHGLEIKSSSPQQIRDIILSLKLDKVAILAPIVSQKKGTHQKVIEELKLQGYLRIFIDDEIYRLDQDLPTLDKNFKHDIALVVDRVNLQKVSTNRINEAIEKAIDVSKDQVVVLDLNNNEQHLFSTKAACPKCGFALPFLEPRLFSFNAPFGSCEECSGIGTLLKVDPNLAIPDMSLSIKDGVFDNINGYKNGSGIQMIRRVCEVYKIRLNTAFNKLDSIHQDILLYGSEDVIKFRVLTDSGKIHTFERKWEGLIAQLERRYLETNSSAIREVISRQMSQSPCKVCNGTRLNKYARSVKIANLNIAEFSILDISEEIEFIESLKQQITQREYDISKLIINELFERLSFLKQVGLEYLDLNRQASTLSGGESQRIRLATQIGSKLSGVLYVLDEPSIGLHQRDNDRLIKTLKSMRDLGNTLIVVEHDEDIMLESDYLVDIGPGAGEHGGFIVEHGTPEKFLKSKKSLTSKYLRNEIMITKKGDIRKGNNRYLEVIGANENNLKNVDLKIPLNKFVCVSGVSGSGKSTLINDTLVKYLQNQLNGAKNRVASFKEIKGIENIKRLSLIDQSPIGRTPRSNPATYTKVFDDIRDLFTKTPDAQLRGFDKGRFSFNVSGGRCDNCNGDGSIKIEMHFLPDVYVDCDVCHGKRYNDQTLEVRFKGKNIAEVLNMTVEEALEFFQNQPKIAKKLQALNDVGLSYIKLGQNSTTLSGGEAQRVKLAAELHKTSTKDTLFVLDEPSTGLHFEDIRKLLNVLEDLVDKGNSVLVIEHNLDIIKVADHIIDLGPNGGRNGGTIVASGTLEEVINNKQSVTGEFLKKKVQI